ncbi:TNF receptor-associated factor 2 [Fasciolopsis buskii]|uniref:TNF receptor-associated factor 2 n=1 Tax=Fasciolopsis buskii TaxID=27845 RepID=A0A8E0S9G4_9TREM|nr:TNF receptor-associated factor 2 [Fasciolopsis buski]
MDELQRLYEHQTMMAIGIYSFLDNLLAHMPSRTEIEVGSTQGLRTTEISSEQQEPLRLRPNLSEASLNDVGSRTDRSDRVSWVPHFSTWTLHGSLPLRQEDESDPVTRSTIPSTNAGEVAEHPGQNESMAKLEVTPGGYPEEIFIYLSEREKMEYICSICYSVLKEAYQCQNQHRYCYGCIYTWSTGPNLGHDGCPVCRCDGLYAKNFDLVDRINRKRVRCLVVGCNWMGTLSEYGPHEHRRYSPYELDILISGCSKESLLKFASSKNKERVATEEQLKENAQVKPEQATVSEVAEERADLLPLIGSMPATCEPVATSLEVTESRGPIQQPTSNLHRIGRYTGAGRNGTPVRTVHRRTHARHNTTAGHTEESVTHPRVSRPVTQYAHPRIGNRGLVSMPVTNPHIPRPLVAGRSVRNGSTPLTQNSENTPVAPTTQLRRRSRRRCRNSARRSVSPPANESQRNTVTTRGFMSATPNRWNLTVPGSSDSVDSTGIEESNPTSNQTRAPALPPPPVISTDSPPSTTFLAARNQLFPVESRSTDQLHDHLVADPHPDGTEHEGMGDRRNEICSLPAINRNATLTTGGNSRLSYDQQTAVIEDRLVERQTSQLQDIPDVPSQRPLEFRRLVPRRQGRVVEQLRETREQLAAMLRLMTMELEERRQHVIAATLETAARGRALRNLNNQLSATLESEGNQQETERTNCNITPSLAGGNSNPQDRQNHNQTSPWNILRNLPIPDRTNQRQSLGLIHFTTGTENYPSNLESGVDDRIRRTLADDSVTNVTPGEDSYLADTETSTSGPPHARLLTRLRVGAIGQSPAPPILLVSRRRNLSSLLSNLRYANSTMYSGWSSDEDET